MSRAKVEDHELVEDIGRKTDVESYIEEKEAAGKWGGAAKVLRKLSRELVEGKVLTRSWRKLTSARLKEIAAELVKPAVKVEAKDADDKER